MNTETFDPQVIALSNHPPEKPGAFVCEPLKAGAIVYASANASGKQPAGRTGAARVVAEWRTFLISTGERSIAAAMSEGGYRAKAGQ
ncbi:MAG: hypothetical protein LBE85_13690 [Candidatus Accumulibacter sp.]|jgi:putative DNA primase/helicase|nr:hypothetical protein [Accumulibacter sp.]